MTVDVEDYFQVSAFENAVPRASWDSRESRVCGNTERLLDLFGAAKIKATFFVLGLGGGAVSRDSCGGLSAKDTSSLRMVSSTGWCTRRRATSSATISGGARAALEQRRRSVRCSGTGRRVTRSFANRCGRSMCSSRRVTSTTPASTRYGTTATGFLTGLARCAGSSGRRIDLGVAGLNDSSGGYQPADWRRGLFPAAAVCVDAPRDPSPECRASSRRFSIFILGRSIPEQPRIAAGASVDVQALSESGGDRAPFAAVC